MLGNKFLLDTNIIIEIFDGNSSYAEKLEKADALYLPIIVLGELYVG